MPNEGVRSDIDEARDYMTFCLLFVLCRSIGGDANMLLEYGRAAVARCVYLKSDEAASLKNELEDAMIATGNSM